MTLCGACAPTAAPAEKSKEPVAAQVTPTATPSPAPSPTPSDAEEPLPDQQLHAGVVGDGVPATLGGTGPAVVGFTRQGDIAVVVDLDCSACQGPVEVTQPDRSSPWGEGVAPFRGAYLVDIFKDTAPEQVVVVRAEGSWTVTLQSWNDLAPVTGAQQGTGSTVLFLGDTASGIQVTYTPAGPDDRFSGRAFSAVEVGPTGPESVLFGDDAAFTETYELAFPGVLAITTDGTWAVTPVP